MHGSRDAFIRMNTASQGYTRKGLACYHLGRSVVAICEGFMLGQ